MGFTFLHAADLHLGSPLIGLTAKDETVARRFAAASREAFSDLVSRAIDLAVAFVVVAGDVYDGEWRDTSIGLFFNREVARLDRAGIPLFLLRGNHDAESVVTKAVSLPPSVHAFPAARAKTFRLDELKVALHGRSFHERSVSENYALGYPDPLPGWFNVGVLHTSCDGRPGHADYAPCSAADLARRGYQYWALGHVHQYEEVGRDPWIVFPGNLQGRSVRECGAKGAVLVDVADGQVAGVQRLILDRARWAEIAVDLGGLDDEVAAMARIEQAIAPLAGEGRLVALRLHLRGKTALHRRIQADRQWFADETQAAAHRCHEDIWLESLAVGTEDGAAPPSAEAVALPFDLAAMLSGIEGDPELIAAADQLAAQVGAKLPAGVGLGEAPPAMAELLAEARDLVLGRLG